MNKEVKSALYRLSPISLGEMDSVQLMNRTDTKFVFSASRLTDLLSRVQEYRVLEINGERNFSYKTTYLDTCDHLFYEQHLKGRLNRHKVRYRLYEATGASFLEIKCKTNQQRTLKWRIKNTIDEFTGNDASLFLSKHLPHNFAALNPAVINRFNRVTLVNLVSKERVTIDFNVSFNDIGSREVKLPYLAIAELKREGYSNSPFLDILKQLHIKSTGFSKYCMGLALLNNTPRTNLLKPKILLLQKLKNEYDVNRSA